MHFIEVSDENGQPFFVNVAHIKTFKTAKNSNRTVLYYNIGADIVLETEEEVIKLIKESHNKIIAQAEKIA